MRGGTPVCDKFWIKTCISGGLIGRFAICNSILSNLRFSNVGKLCIVKGRHHNGLNMKDAWLARLRQRTLSGESMQLELNWEGLKDMEIQEIKS